MYWWHKAAQAVREGRAERFGFITTNSLTQSFNRRVVEYNFDTEPPLALAFAVPDHPWVDAALGAAVRVAMTVGVPGPADGELVEVVGEGRGEEDARHVEVTLTQGQIHPDLTVGADVASAGSLKANDGLSNRGIRLVGKGFLVPADEAKRLAAVAPKRIRPYRNGQDLTRSSRDVSAIDLYGLSEDEARTQHPALYSHLLDTVKPDRDQSKRKTYRDNWWIFAEPVAGHRRAIRDLDRYVATVMTAKHRMFQFLSTDVLPDQGLVAIATDDAYHLGVLSSRIHQTWALAAGGRLGVGNDPRYTTTSTFQPFPFPDATDAQRETIRQLGERLDAHRARVQSEHPTLTLTGLYNALAAVREGRELSKKERADYGRGQVAILRETHDALDAAVAEAYGWPAHLTDQQVLVRLVALNIERQAEEAAGLVRYLRPAFQAPGETTQAEISLDAPTATTSAAEPEPWPAETAARALALRRVLREVDRPMTVEAVAQRFRRAPRAAVADLLDTLATLGQARQVEACYAA